MDSLERTLLRNLRDFPIAVPLAVLSGQQTFGFQIAGDCFDCSDGFTDFFLPFPFVSHGD